MKRTKEIPSATGLGLFAKEEIKEGEYIEYTGDIITTKEADSLKKARSLPQTPPLPEKCAMR